MRIAGLQKLTLIDYPEHTAATVFVSGCNFRCPFCYNSELVIGGGTERGRDTALPEEAVFALLAKRHGLLDGVCITGAEPTLQPDLAKFCARVHEAGFDVKLDTNGSRPEVLFALLEAGLLDYVALDIKNIPTGYAASIGLPDAAATRVLDSVRESVGLLADANVAHEYRTTVVAELHTRDDLILLAGLLEDADPDAPWYLQDFRDADTVLAGSGVFHPFGDTALKDLLDELVKQHRHTELRGIG